MTRCSRNLIAVYSILCCAENSNCIADDGFHALANASALRTLAVEVSTNALSDFSGCVSLRALNITLWKVL